MSRSAIPPSRAKAKGSPLKTLQLLQKKLETAEAETVSLVRQLSDLGFQQPSGGKIAGPAAQRSGERKTQKGVAKGEPVRPFLPRSAESDVLHKNYETLVSRVCSTESQIQTLKLNLCTLQAERDLNGDEVGKLQDKLTQQAESHEQEVKKLNREVVLARKEWKDAIEARNTAEEDVKRLTSALEIATKTKSELAIEYEEFKTTKGKLNRRIAELREELAREVSLRTSLEDSHTTLLNRIQEMENVVEAERQEVDRVYTEWAVSLWITVMNKIQRFAKILPMLDISRWQQTLSIAQVQTLAIDCSELRREGVRIQEEKKHEASYRLQLEQTIYKLKSESGNKEVKLTEVLEENKVLGANLSSLKRENINLQQQLEQLQNENAKFQKLQATMQIEEKRKSTEKEQGILKVELQKLKDAYDMAEQKRNQLELELNGIKTRFSQQAEDYKAQIQLLEHTVQDLKTELLSIQTTKNNVMKAKENLLDEVNQAVDSMSDERTRLQEQVQQAQHKVSVMAHDKARLQQENNRLMGRIAAVEQQQIAQQKVESSMAEMLESKNRLAYEKGQLQSQVAELQRQLTLLASTQSDLQRQRKVNATLQARFDQARDELSQMKTVLQRLEGQLKQEQANCRMKEQDFSMAIQARDEAVKEAQTLRSQLAAVEKRGKQKVQSLQQSLTDAKVDQGKIATTLDGVMGSHQQLQQAVERLQIELGRKDNELTSLKQDRHDRQQATNMLQREVEQLQAKLISIETSESDQLNALQSELSRLKEDKVQMSATLDELIQTNGQLQAAVEKQRNDLEKKSYECELLQQPRTEDKELLQDIRNEYEERLAKLREQILSKKQVGNKKLQRELEEVKGQNELLNSKMVQLTQSNSNFQKKVSQLEDTISKHTNRIRSQKTQLEHYHHMKKQQEESSSKMAAIQQQLAGMEKANKEYVAKNKEQAKTIASFVGQMKRMENELKAVAQAQQDMTHTSKRKEIEFYKERGKQETLLEKTSRLEQEVTKLREQRDRAEEKLMEISSESLQISSNLEEAHNWFKTRYDTLQQELAESKQRQTHLERVNSKQQQQIASERTKATEQALKAKSMIRTSREALSRVADKAEINHLETKTQMRTMTYKLQAEKDHATMTDRKLHKIMNSSAQYIEELSAELELSRMQEIPTT